MGTRGTRGSPRGVAVEVLGLRARNRALLHRQLLSVRAELTVDQAVAQLAGMQAQSTKSPHLGLWTRLAGFTTDDLDAALLDRERSASR